MRQYCDENNFFKPIQSKTKKIAVQKGREDNENQYQKKSNKENEICHVKPLPTNVDSSSAFVSFQHDSSKLLPTIYSDEKKELSMIGITPQFMKNGNFINETSAYAYPGFNDNEIEETVMPLNVKPANIENNNSFKRNPICNEFKIQDPIEFGQQRIQKTEIQKKDNTQKEILKMIIELNNVS